MEDDYQSAMRLPGESTCGDCRHIRRCKGMFGHVEADTFCDWHPVRFVLANAPEPPDA